MAQGKRIARKLLTAAAFSGLLSVPASGQQDQEPADSFEEAVRVQVVNLEVVVTNQEDERVSGLRREDFVLRVDGREVPIRYFSEVGPGADEGGESRPESAEPVNFLVFIDEHVSLSRNRDLTLEKLRGELPLLGPRDRMAVVAYDGRKISVLSSWTGDKEALDVALLEAVERPSIGIRWVALARNRDFVANWIGNATRRSILAAGSSMRLLPRPSGRKVMLLVAGSWDPREVRAAKNFSPWCPSGPCAGNYVFFSLTDTANELGYAIYAVDVEGRDVQHSWSREQRLQLTLAMMARLTGGRTLLNGERTRVLSIASADSRSYYSIGISPEVVEDNQRHRVEIEVLKPGLEARARESFVALSEKRQSDVETFAAVLADVDAAAPAFPVEVGSVEKVRGRRMRVPITIFAPSGELDWLAAGRLFKARFEVGLATLDVYGNSTVEVRQIVLEEPSAAVQGEAELLDFELVLKRRRHSVAVVVKDLQGDGRFTAMSEIEPPEDEAPQADDESLGEAVSDGASSG